MPRTLHNFGGTVRFTPRHRYTPATEAELLAILDRHAHGRIRAVGARHSWNSLAASDDVSVDLRRFDGVRVGPADGASPRTAVVGAGCTIGRLVRELRTQADSALSTLGAVTRQTVAGAIATGTHGSGAASMSDLVEAVRVAAYDPVNGRARIHEWDSGAALHAARCGLGRTGIVTAVTLRCEPGWHVEERVVTRQTLEEVLAGEVRFPLQMSLLMPHAWSWLVFQRRRAEPGARAAATAPLYRAYGRAHIDFLMHALLRLLTLRGDGALLRPLLRAALPAAFVRGWRVVDRYDRMLTLAHDWFRHEEMELAVPTRHVARATSIVQRVTTVFADRGEYTHHYPILMRRVLPDRALLSVTGDASEPWYTLSFFNYQPPARRAAFRAYAAVLARELATACDARPHWGKLFPLNACDVVRLYGADRIARFRTFCASVDPNGVFGNVFTTRVLGA